MRILEDKSVNHWTSHRTCSHCHSRLIVELEEVKVSQFGFYYICGACAEVCIVPSMEIPGWYKSKLRET